MQEARVRPQLERVEPAGQGDGLAVVQEPAGGTDHLIAYSLKANGNLAVVATLARLGAGGDVVSGGELTRALAAGIPGERIIFSGVGKTEAEMRQALDAGIHQFNVESEPELDCWIGWPGRSAGARR